MWRLIEAVCHFATANGHLIPDMLLLAGFVYNEGTCSYEFPGAGTPAAAASAHGQAAQAPHHGPSAAAAPQAAADQPSPGLPLEHLEQLRRRAAEESDADGAAAPAAASSCPADEAPPRKPAPRGLGYGRAPPHPDSGASSSSFQSWGDLSGAVPAPVPDTGAPKQQLGTGAVWSATASHHP